MMCVVMMVHTCRFSLEFANTSSHKLRSPYDLQFSFSYFYYLMSEPAVVDHAKLFAAYDTDGSGYVLFASLCVCMCVHRYLHPLHPPLHRYTLFSLTSLHPHILPSTLTFSPPLSHPPLHPHIFPSTVTSSPPPSHPPFHPHILPSTFASSPPPSHSPFHLHILSSTFTSSLPPSQSPFHPHILPFTLTSSPSSSHLPLHPHILPSTLTGFCLLES